VYGTKAEARALGKGGNRTSRKSALAYARILFFSIHPTQVCSKFEDVSKWTELFLTKTALK
jgi:hypothetical protein